jgi:enoyl-[acyl-carrier protein] reductase II
MMSESLANNRICSLFGINFPIIQAGMVWCSGWELAAAVSEAGGLGIIGSGSMYPEVLRQHIRKCKSACNRPFAINLPLLYPQIEEHLNIIHEEGVNIVFTSAGNPAKYTPMLKNRGCTVVHVVSSSRFAEKAEAAGCDAVVAEGFEAGGHNGREETTSFCLIPEVVRSVSIPVIAAGGIGSGKAMLAAMVLGAEAVQIGSLFVASKESSAHQNFKEKVVNAKEGDTLLTFKELTPVRLLKNPFVNQIMLAYERGAGKDELRELLGRGRAKKGMFEGDITEGELEIGQVASQIQEILPASVIIKRLLEEYKAALTDCMGEDRFQW